MLHARLVVVGGDMDTSEVSLTLPAVVGRGRDASIHLAHPLVSRRHCELRECEGRLRVRDLDSLNGTFVGSERIQDAELGPGQLLTVGTVTFRALYEPTSDSVGCADSTESILPASARESATALTRPSTGMAESELAEADTKRLEAVDATGPDEPGKRTGLGRPCRNRPTATARRARIPTSGG